MNAEEIGYLVKNALDFLRSSIRELTDSVNGGKPEQLKFSVIHFHTAMELLIKARLLSEHWALVFADMQKINIKSFKSGDFKSVGFRDSIRRAENLSHPPEFSQNAMKAFDAIAQYRNRIIHFSPYPNAEKAAQEMIKAQLHAWYHLHALCNKEWEFMKPYGKEVAGINSQHKELGKYLTVVYENVQCEIESLMGEGHIFQKCMRCEFESVKHGKEYKVIHHAHCMVCDFSAQSVLIQCDECGEIVSFYDEGFATCKKCGKEFEPADLVDVLGWNPQTKDDLSDLGASDPGYCIECTNNAVVRLSGNDKWACLGCLTESDDDEIHQCDYCSGIYMGEYNELTWAFGCGMCEGRHGDDKS